MASDLATIERACQCVLGGVGTAAERAQAQQRVLELGSTIQNITLIQAILDGSTDNYAIVVAAQSLLRLVTGENTARLLACAEGCGQIAMGAFMAIVAIHCRGSCEDVGLGYAPFCTQ